MEDGKHDAWVAKSNTAFRNGGFRGTPTVLLNGESIFPDKGGEQISVANLKKWVAEANKGKKPGTQRSTPALRGLPRLPAGRRLPPQTRPAYDERGSLSIRCRVGCRASHPAG